MKLVKSTKLLVLFTMMLIAAVAAQVAVDCRRRPDYIDLMQCCKLPEIKWNNVAPQCSTPRMKYPNPCALECIFNSTNALQQDTLNMPNVRLLLQKIFNGNEDFVQAYALGYEKCQAPISKKVTEMRERGHGLTNKTSRGHLPHCSPVAVFYTTCAHRNVFLDCPATAWSATTKCEGAKEFVRNCETHKLGGGRGGGAMGRRGGRGGGPGGPGGSAGAHANNGFHYERHRV